MARRKSSTRKKARQVTMNVSMPAVIRRMVEERVERRGFGNASEYVRHLIRNDPAEGVPDWLEDRIAQGLRGPFETGDDAWWTERSARLEAAIKGKRRRKSA